jgi:hypothetical protein
LHAGASIEEQAAKAERAKALHLLCEGNSARAITRLTRKLMIMRTSCV